MVFLGYFFELDFLGFKAHFEKIFFILILIFNSFDTFESFDDKPSFTRILFTLLYRCIQMKLYRFQSGLHCPHGQ